MGRIEGKASAEGTRRYRSRHAGNLHPEAYREVQDLALSSIGLGTYLGDATDEADGRYTEAVRAALAGGCNVLDTAINYRNQRSERAIGAALRQMIGEGALARDEVFISTKGGFIPFDRDRPANAREYFLRNFVEVGLVEPTEVVAGCHVLTPTYLKNQLDCSLANLGLETIDLYYIHNPEIQLTEVSSDIFNERLLKVFRHLETEVSAGRIQYYGTATWSGYRSREGAAEYLNLAAVESLAREAGGENHHFRFIQLPLNLGMLEAWRGANQQGRSGKTPPLSLARERGIHVMTSGSILQGRLARDLPEAIRRHLGDLATDAQRSLNFTRSAPGVATALVGMGSAEHVQENLKVLEVAALTEQQLDELF